MAVSSWLGRLEGNPIWAGRTIYVGNFRTFNTDADTGEDDRVSFAPERDFREAVSQLFARVKAELSALLPGSDIQHVGSTAIPGSLTKGDLDVQVRVKSEKYDAAKDTLSKRYQVNPGGFVAEDAISFEDYSSHPSLGVHLTVIDGSADIRWRFRDLLIASSTLTEEYDSLKRRFDGGSMGAYRDEKATFVERVLRDASIIKCGITPGT